MQAFINNLLPAVAKAKLQAKAPFGKPKDSDIMDLGMTFGCLKDLPESPSEIASLLKDVSLKAASGAVASQLQSQNTQQGFAVQLQATQYQQQQAQPQYARQQYVPPQEQQQIQPQNMQPQVVQYVYLPQPYPQYPPNQQRKYQVQRLIDDGIEKNKKDIQMESAYLSPNEIEDLYERNKKKNAAGMAILGGTIGLGISGYIQGNIVMGVVQSLLDVLGSTLLIVAPEICYDGKVHYDCLEGHIAVVAGYAFLIASRITGPVSTIVYQNNYNKTLEDALNGYGLSYSIDPLIIPKDGTPAVGLAFNLRY